MSIDLESLRALLVKVKPSLADEPVSPSSALSDDLGLDSLDLLQLGRHLQRTTGAPFVMDDWLTALKQQQPPQRPTISGLMQALSALRNGT